MLRKITYLLVVLLLTAAVVSCAGDMPQPDVPAMPAVKGKLKVTFYIKQAGVAPSRASEADGPYVDGDETEGKIGRNGNFIILFDKDSIFSKTVLLELSEANNNDSYLESRYECTLDPDDYDSNPYEKLPRYCLFVINGVDLFGDFYNCEGKTVKEVERYVLTAASNNFGINSEGLFVMTNSGYFNADGKDMHVVELKRDMIFDSSDPARVTLFPEGEKMYQAPELTVYVERVSAKHTISFEDKQFDEQQQAFIYKPEKAQPLIFFAGYNDNGAPKYKEVEWQIALTGWNVNGLGKRSHLFKQVDRGPEGFPTFKWNDPGRFRTYWSIDPDYVGPYAIQYRKSQDYKTDDYYQKMESDGRNSLLNYSFNQLELDACKFGQSLYTPENTYDYKALSTNLADRTDLLAGTHVVLGGRLQTKLNGSFGNNDIYRDRDGFYFESELDCFDAKMFDFNNLLVSQDKMKFTYYNWSGQKLTAVNPGVEGTAYYAYTDGAFTINYNGQPLTTSNIKQIFGNSPSIMIEATVKNGDGRRLPWPATGVLTITGPSTVYIYNEAGARLRVADQDDIRSLLFEWLGAIDHFNDGRVYYAAPARISPKEAIIDNKYVDLCGVVRNNWYQFNLVNISGIGTPVDNPDQPIIPDPINNNDQINFTVNIKDWHVIDINGNIIV